MSKLTIQRHSCAGTLSGSARGWFGSGAGGASGEASAWGALAALAAVGGGAAGIST